MYAKDAACMAENVVNNATSIVVAAVESGQQMKLEEIGQAVRVTSDWIEELILAKYEVFLAFNPGSGSVAADGAEEEGGEESAGDGEGGGRFLVSVSNRKKGDTWGDKPVKWKEDFDKVIEANNLPALQVNKYNKLFTTMTESEFELFKKKCGEYKLSNGKSLTDVAYIYKPSRSEG